jgi:micrococcal nuclease
MKKINIWTTVFVFGLLAGIFVLFSGAGSGSDGTVPKIVDLPPTMPVPTSIFARNENAEIVFVPRIIDGDTIQVETVNPTTGVPGKIQTVRYVGMDTPETVDPKKPVECYGHEASARDKALVEGKYVAITKDVSEHDKYGRLLRFVYLLDATNTMVNLELVKEGYARVLTIPPDVEYEDEFNAAASSAQAMKLGFWGACPTYPFE